MILKLVGMLGLKYLGKRIALMLVNKFLRAWLKELTAKSETKMDDEIAKELMDYVEEKLT